jgi:hypothetical protein
LVQLHAVNPSNQPPDRSFRVFRTLRKGWDKGKRYSGTRFSLIHPDSLPGCLRDTHRKGRQKKLGLKLFPEAAACRNDNKVFEELFEHRKSTGFI